MVSLRKKSLQIIEGLMAVCMICIYCSCIQIYATEPASTSTDSYLRTLTVTPGTMTPSFSPETTGYMIAVADDVEQVKVECSTMSSEASVIDAKGFKNLKKGNNTAYITVKAPDGTICTYNFNIVRGGASNGAPNVYNSSDGFSEFSIGSTLGAAISLKQNNETAAPVTTPAVTAPTATEAPTVTEAPTTEEPTTEEPVATEPEPTENTGAEEGELTEGEEPAVETMAPIIPDTGERYQIGGESIYADYYVKVSFDTQLLPEGFAVEPYDFNGATVQSAYLASGNIRLLYSEAEDGSNGGLRIYYEDDKSVLDFVPFLGYNGYIFPVRYQAQIPVPQNYTGSFMPFEKKVVACYIYTELTDNPLSVPEGMENKNTLQPGESTADADPVDASSLDETPEFYLFYGMNNNGQENFYLYDWVEGTYQRYVERDTSYDLDQSYFKYKDMANRRFAFMCALIVLLIIAIFVIVNLFMKNKELKQDLENDFEEDENDEEESEEDDMEIEDLSDDAYEDDTYEDDSEEYEYEDELSDEDSDEEDFGEYEEFEDDEEYIPEEPEVPEEPKKPTVGLTLSDFENSLQLDSEENEDDEEDDIEKKIISQVEKAGANQKPDSSEISKDARPTEFKMINLSRDPEPNGIDDDFEFEFIKFDDN